MPITHTIDAERRLVRSRIWGVVTEAETRASVAALLNDPSFDPTFAQLADMRELIRVDVGASTIRDMAVMHLFDPESRRALVVTSGLQRGIAHMTTTYADLGDQQIALFEDVVEAERWLGIDTHSARSVTRAPSIDQPPPGPAPPS
jgi:hypothetical protein